MSKRKNNQILTGAITIIMIISATFILVSAVNKIFNIDLNESKISSSVSPSDISENINDNIASSMTETGQNNQSEGLKSDSKLQYSSDQLSKSDNSNENTLSSKSDSQNNLNPLKVYYFDVGQADAILIILPNQKTIVIDAGESQTQELLASLIKNAGVSKINAVVVTHPHADHIGGMSYLIRNISVDKIYMSKSSTTTKTFENLLLTIAEKKIAVTEAKSGVKISLDPDVNVNIVAPINLIPDNINENSVIVKIIYGKNSFLFMGDAGEQEESSIIDNGTNLKSDVLKVGHHGSPYSSSFAFLKLVQPSYAIISVGANNDYGHPSDKIINRLSSLNIKTLRTDLSGTILVTSDGQNLKIKTSK